MIDCHVNLLPDWATPPNASDEFDGETANMKRVLLDADSGPILARTSSESVLSNMSKADVAHAICFSFQWNSAERCHLATSYVAETVEQNSDRLSGLAVIQPSAPNSCDLLDSWLSRPGMIGLKVKPKWGDFSLADMNVMGPICETLVSRGAILLTHISQNFHHSEGDNVADLITLLENFPELTVVAAHLGGFLGVYEVHEPIACKFQNLYVDVSLPKSIAWLPHLMRLGDRERYVYGTDFPFSEFDEIRDLMVREGGLTDAECRLICEDNPRKLLECAGVNFRA